MGRKGGVPFPTGFDGLAGVVAHEGAGVGVVGGAAYVLQAPVEGLDPAIVVGGPAAMLVAANFAFKPAHEGGCQFLVYSRWFQKQKSQRCPTAQEGTYTETSEFAETT